MIIALTLWLKVPGIAALIIIAIAFNAATWRSWKK